jgi:hypothetical protein
MFKQPEDLILGKPMYFATAHPFPTGAIPVLVKSDAFRPIKLEGNPEHPASKGKSDAFTQASLLDLYDPDRSQHTTYRGENKSFGQFQEAFATAVKQTGDGKGVYFLSETITSPTLAAQWKQVQAKYPQAKLIQYDPVNRDSARSASKAAFGDYYDAQYKLEEADVILSLGADFLGGIGQPGFLSMAAGYAERHRDPEKPMNRLYVVESMPSVTGFKAEHRLALKPSDIRAFTLALVNGSALTLTNPEAQKFFDALLSDLKKNSGKVAIIPGESSSPVTHAVAIALNQAYAGKTVVYTETVNPLPTEQTAELKSLVADMNAGKVAWLVMLGANPLYNAPVDLNFLDAFNKVPHTVHLGMYGASEGIASSETALLSEWHINQAHYLESWSDARSSDGTLCIIQPMIAPLYGGVSAHDVLQTLIDPSISAFNAVQANAKQFIKGDFETGWRKALHDGWVDGTAFTPKTVSAKAAVPAASMPSATGLEIRFLPDPSLYDGRYANNGWLQELPKQVTNLCWDNGALMSMHTMAALKLEETDVVELDLNGRKVKAPVLMVPGHPDGSITVHLGFGRRSAGRVGTGVGFDAYQLRTCDAPILCDGPHRHQDQRQLCHLRDQGAFHGQPRQVRADGP